MRATVCKRLTPPHDFEALQAELAKVEATAAGHRADYERERDRADKVLSEVLRATVDLISAKELTARTEGDLAVVRAQAEGEVAAVRTWRLSWRRSALVAGGGVEREFSCTLPAHVAEPRRPRSPPVPPTGNGIPNPRLSISSERVRRRR